MKNLILLLSLFLAPFYRISAQISSSNCYADSIWYHSIDTIIDTMVISQQRYLFNNKELSAFLKRRDPVCSIKNYAVVFDHIFSRGLDVSKRLPKPGYRNNRYSLDSVQNAAYRKMDLNPSQRIYDLFYLFIDIKGKYEMEMLEAGNLDLYKEYIEKLIEYGHWNHPESVRNVLLLKYTHITREKFYVDMRYYHGNK